MDGVTVAPGQVVLLENCRVNVGEKKNAEPLARKLAALCDIFVNDAFGTAHRAHASTAGVADYLPAVCGYLVQKEVSIMGKALADPVLCRGLQKRAAYSEELRKPLIRFSTVVRPAFTSTSHQAWPAGSGVRYSIPT